MPPKHAAPADADDTKTPVKKTRNSKASPTKTAGKDTPETGPKLAKMTKLNEFSDSDEDVKPARKKAKTVSKRKGAWSGEELKELYFIMNPKRTGINWAEVAAQMPGRDMKSIQNKWARMQPKIIAAVTGLGD